MRIQEILRESWQLVKVTPLFIKNVRKTAKNIALDIADDLPQDDTQLGKIIVNLLQRIDVICGINQTMLICRAELRPKSALRGVTSVGCHWTWHDDSAKVYHHENAYDSHNKNAKLIEMIFTGVVPFAAIDWVYTIATNLIHPAEREITIKPNSEIKMSEIYYGDKVMDCKDATATTFGYYNEIS